MASERPASLKRVNVYVDPDDLDQVARELGCRRSDAVRHLIDNYLLAAEIDAARRLPGPGPDPIFRRGPAYALPATAEDTVLSGEDAERDR
jgi:hypothetical protein